VSAWELCNDGRHLRSREFFTDALTEIAGYKAGVVLTGEELLDIMRDDGDLTAILDPAGPGGGRIRSSLFEEAVVTLLHRLGNTPSDSNVPIIIEMYHRYRNGEQAAIYDDLMELYLAFMATGSATPKDGLIDPRPLMREMHGSHGVEGARMTLELIEGIGRDMHRSDWGRVRNADWNDTVELTGLFKSAGLETQHAHFGMHWREFEGFTAEYFEREAIRSCWGRPATMAAPICASIPRKRNRNVLP
jgi:restriction system protein